MRRWRHLVKEKFNFEVCVVGTILYQATEKGEWETNARNDFDVGIHRENGKGERRKRAKMRDAKCEGIKALNPSERKLWRGTNGWRQLYLDENISRGPDCLVADSDVRGSPVRSSPKVGDKGERGVCQNRSSIRDYINCLGEIISPIYNLPFYPASSYSRFL